MSTRYEEDVYDTTVIYRKKQSTKYFARSFVGPNAILQAQHCVRGLILAGFEVVGPLVDIDYDNEASGLLHRKGDLIDD